MSDKAKIVITLIVYGVFGIVLAVATVKPDWTQGCESLRADANEHLQAVTMCASSPGCQYSSESIRVALDKKNRAEACK